MAWAHCLLAFLVTVDHLALPPKCNFFGVPGSFHDSLPLKYTNFVGRVLLCIFLNVFILGQTASLNIFLFQRSFAVPSIFSVTFSCSVLNKQQSICLWQALSAGANGKGWLLIQSLPQYSMVLKWSLWGHSIGPMASLHLAPATAAPWQMPLSPDWGFWQSPQSHPATCGSSCVDLAGSEITLIHKGGVFPCTFHLVLDVFEGSEVGG